MNLLATISQLPTGETNSGLSNLETAMFNDSTALDPSSNLLESIMPDFVGMVEHSSNAMLDNINQMQQQVAQQRVMNTADLLSLQQNSSELMTGVTVGAKVVNMGVKFVNELTHLQ